MTQSDTPAWQGPLLDLAWVLARRRLLIVMAVGLGLCLGVLKYLVTPDSFRATANAILLPRDKPTVDLVVTASSMETSDDSARRSDSGSLMLPAEPELYIALMTSRGVLEGVAQQLAERLVDSGPVKEGDRSDEIVDRLRSMIRIEGTNEGMLSVTATAEDPVLAADIANLLVDAASSASKEIERQLLLQQAAYLAETVSSTRSRLLDTEAQLEAFHSLNDMVDPQLQASDQLRQLRELSAVQDRALRDLAARRVSYTDEDPAVRALLAELDQTSLRMGELKGQSGQMIGEGDYGRLAIQYRGLVEELRFRRDLLTTLSTQADVFRIRAEQPAGNIAVVRPAVPPSKRAGPSKKKTLGAAIAAALVLGLALSLVLEQITALRSHDTLADRFDEVLGELLRPPALPFTRRARARQP